MQLKPNEASVDPGTKSKPRGKIAASLAAATCSLLAAAPGPSLAEEAPKRWTFDTGLLYYSETDRIDDASLSILARRTFASGKRLSFKFGADTLTGASASGAAPSTIAQTFSTPSGGSAYTAGPGETPLDPSFLDTRISLSANLELAMTRRWGTDVGFSFSNEYDYFHAGVNGRFYRDFNGRNTRLTFGLAFASDSIEPEGGVPVPLSAMQPGEYEDDDDDKGAGPNRLGDESKTTTDFLVGVTQVLGRRTLAQFNYSYSNVSGYQTDPYKIISVVDPLTGLPSPGPGSLNLYRFENRPDARTKHSLYAQVKHHLKRDIVDVGYRFMTDDWGLTSHTIDTHYRFNLGQKWYLQPHVRYYMQSKADFWVPYLQAGDPVPQHATADYRLGEFDAITFGAKYARQMDRGREWSIRAEFYTQSGTSPPGVGVLRDLDLYPTVDAVILQAGYRF